MFCENCGKNLPDGAKFCNGCGAKIEPEQPAYTAAAEPALERPVPPPPVYTPPGINWFRAKGFILKSKFTVTCKLIF